MSNEQIRNYDTATLWALVGDITTVMEQRNYKPRKDDTAFMYWYEQYKVIESEINRRLVIDNMEG